MRILLMKVSESDKEMEQAIREWWAKNNTFHYPGFPLALAMALDSAEFEVTVVGNGEITIEAVA